MQETQIDQKIRGVLQSKMKVPDPVQGACMDAFARIRTGNTEVEGKIPAYRRIWKRIAGSSAAAATVSVSILAGVCAANPAFAEKLPLIGHIFERSGYEAVAPYAEVVQKPENTTAADSSGTEGMDAGGLSQTFNGTTVTISETYSNAQIALISYVIHSEEKLPDTMTDQFGQPEILLDAALKVDSAEGESVNRSPQGSLIDEHTYAGVYAASSGEFSSEFPDQFNAQLQFSQIFGTLPEEKQSVPEIPVELKQKYNDGMKALGLDEDNYQNFTEGQKKQEHKLFSEMMNAYYERYPELAGGEPNACQDWVLKGDWNFTIPMKSDPKAEHTITVAPPKDIDIAAFTVRKTPLTISNDSLNQVEVGGDNRDQKLYEIVYLDHNGRQLQPFKGIGDTNVVSTIGRDVSTVDLYICDYNDYMDNLKPRSVEGGEKAEAEPFRQMLEEKALYHEQLAFDS
ncbi:DUF4179 domain-containing protein [Porcincola intestinalis]